ncbi:MAG: hypothetical protein RMJ14_02345 [Nitrososphaerota archaeon]|nr:hypothetical protein [Nitrososphaerota archaeon]
MPPAKVKMTITVDPQVAEYLEGLHRKLVQKMIEERRRPLSFSQFMNDWLLRHISEEMEKTSRSA